MATTVQDTAVTTLVHEAIAREGLLVFAPSAYVLSY